MSVVKNTAPVWRTVYGTGVPASIEEGFIGLDPAKPATCNVEILERKLIYRLRKYQKHQGPVSIEGMNRDLRKKEMILGQEDKMEPKLTREGPRIAEGQLLISS